MNSAKRILDILKEIQSTKNYYKACEKLFNCEDAFLQLYFYRYFLNDLKSIEKALIDTEKYKEHIHKDKIELVAKLISPNYILDDKLPNSIQSDLSFLAIRYKEREAELMKAIEFMELVESFIPNEVFYSDEIEKLRVYLKGLQKTDTFLDSILQEIDEAVLYYGYFGNNIIEDKFHKVLGKILVNTDKIKPYIKKFSKVIEIILLFIDFYKKTKELKEDATLLLEWAKKELENNKEQ